MADPCLFVRFFYLKTHSVFENRSIIRPEKIIDKRCIFYGKNLLKKSKNFLFFPGVGEKTNRNFASKMPGCQKNDRQFRRRWKSLQEIKFNGLGVACLFMKTDHRRRGAGWVKFVGAGQGDSDVLGLQVFPDDLVVD